MSTISPQNMPQLGVCLDHFATLRQLRNTTYPSITEAARVAVGAQADQIIVHLRQDHLSVQEKDVVALKNILPHKLHLELTPSPNAIKFAVKIKPASVRIVTEIKDQLQVARGFDLEKKHNRLHRTIDLLHQAGIQVSLFIEPLTMLVGLAKTLGADIVELNAERYARAPLSSLRRAQAFERLRRSALYAHRNQLRCHIGRGINYDNVESLSALTQHDRLQGPLFHEFSVGHAVVCRAALVGLDQAVREMGALIRAP